jgi:Cu(I)/Ag(I) efflux system membrane protein CusA/SilA
VIAALIDWSLRRRVLVLMLATVLALLGVLRLPQTPVDALPDLSDVQVIVRATWMGQAPQVIEDQVTYPLATTMLGVPRAHSVRAFSMYGDAFVYVIFDDGTDLYWARSRVLEALSRVSARLPAAAKVELGPDATGVGWVYQYALVDRTGRHDLGELRALQDWQLRFELAAVPGVAEVASLGGMVRQFEVTPDPERLRALGVGLDDLVMALQSANAELGAGAIEVAEAETMVRTRGYLRDPAQLARLPVRMVPGEAPLLLGDVATVGIGAAPRRGIGELDGQGEVAGGVVVMRSGENAAQVIAAVKRRIEELKPSLPPGVEIVPTYDRSALIQRAIDHLRTKLVEEFIAVALVCAVFLMHLRSAFVAIVCLPLGVLASLLTMQALGINANIMSLGGIAIALGTMVDAAIVCVENVHKHLERWRRTHGEAAEPSPAEHFALVREACIEVGPAVFFSLLVVTVSFLPVFALEAQEGRLFEPLAWTKTLAMAAGAGLSVTLIPVLCLLLVRGRLRREEDNPLNRWLIAIYRVPALWVLARPRATLGIALLVLVASAWPLSRLGSEFMPPLEEGDLLYMPSALPGLSPQKASELLQLTDRIIKSFPEVHSVHGKAGRAETATDPAPLEMLETVVQLKPRSEWRAGMTPEKLIEELDAAVHLPGLRNVWVQPIRNRIDMLATGVKSPVAVKVAGADLATIEQVAERVAAIVRTVPGTRSAFAERTQGGRYLDIDIDPAAAARHGLTQMQVQDFLARAVGGEPVGEIVDGRARFPLALRWPRDARDSPEALMDLVLVNPMGQSVPLRQVARIALAEGPAMIRSENARPVALVYIDVAGRDLGGYVADARAAVAAQLAATPGISLAWSGQFEAYERARARLATVLPLTLVLIVVLLFFAFSRMGEVALVLSTLPFALVGGVWLVYLLGQDLSVASAVGFIALAGLAAEFGVVMLVYLDRTLAQWQAEGRLRDPADVVPAIIEGAVLRVRPKAMTVLTIIAGLAPVMAGEGAGAEIMRRIAAPMLGGMLSAPLLSMLVLPAAYLLLVRARAPETVRVAVP